MTAQAYLVENVRPRDKSSAFLADLVVHDGVLHLVGGTNHEPTILVSSDAKTFHKRKTPDTSGLRSMLKLEDGRTFVCGEYGRLAVTTDGQTWTNIETGTKGCLFAVKQDAAGDLWVSGDDGLVLHSTDDGQSWTKRDAKTGARLQNIVVEGDTLYFLGHDGTLFERQGGGEIREMLRGSAAFTDVVRTSHGLFVSGDGGQLLRSTDDGKSFAPVGNAPRNVDLEAMAKLGDELFVVGARGTVLHSVNGSDFTLLPTSVSHHLFSICASGGGVFVGGEGSCLLHIHREGDSTWVGKEDSLGEETRKLDDFFRAHEPDTFLTTGLAELVGGVDPSPRAFEKDFEAVWGTPMPVEIAAFLKAIEKEAAAEVLYELRPENGVVEAPTEDVNVFQELVKRDQEGYLGTSLVEALAGVCYIGTYGNGDSHLVNVYGDAAFAGGAPEPSGPRTVLIFDHEEHSLSFETATSLNRFAYFSALTQGMVDENVSEAAARASLDKLAGTITPSWHFRYRLEEGGCPDFAGYEDANPVSRIWYARALWLLYFFRNDGIVDVGDLGRVFFESHNPPLVGNVHARWLESSTRFVPTALYCLLRGYLFDDATLDEYLTMARKHSSRLVRDCARTIDDLMSGKLTSLGNIEDVADHKRRLQALDLDPARAEERKAEAEARKAALAKARADARARVAELADPVSVAWETIEDLAMHEAIEARLRAEPGLKATFAAVDFVLNRDFVRENLVLEHEANEELGWLGLHGDLAVVPLLLGTLVRPPAPAEDAEGETEEEEEEREKTRKPIALSHPNSVGDILQAFGRRGRIDARALPALRKMLGVEEKYEFRRTHVVTLLGHLGDRESIPALEALFATLHAEDYGDVLRKKPLAVAIARAFGRMGDPRAVPALSTMLEGTDDIAKGVRSHVAMALAELDVVESWPALVAHTAKDDRKPTAWTLWALALLTGKADASTKKQIAAAMKNYASRYTTKYTAIVAATVLARAGEPPVDFAAQLEEAFTTFAYDAENTKLQEYWALRAIGVTDVNPQRAKAYLLRDDDELRTAAREALEQRGEAVPQPRFMFRAEVARLEAEGGSAALLTAFNDETSVYRHVVAARLAELGATNARESLLRYARGLVARIPNAVGVTVGTDPHYPLAWTLKALVDLGPTPELRAFFGELLVHASRDVKGLALRSTAAFDDDPSLIGPMLKVQEEKWGWQESAAAEWLEGAKAKHPAAYEAALEKLRQS